MTKPDGYTAGRNIFVQFSDGGGVPVWTTISAFIAEVAPDVSTRPTAETHVSSEDTPIVTVGARQMRRVQFTLIYTEATTHPAGDVYRDILLPAHTAETNIPMRWSPFGATAGDSIFTTDEVYTQISELAYPAKSTIGDAEMIKIQFAVVACEVVHSIAV